MATSQVVYSLEGNDTCKVPGTVSEAPVGGLALAGEKSESVSCSVVSAWTVAHQAPLSMEFSGQEYWIELPVPPPGDLPDPGIEPGSPALKADSLPSEP